MIVADLGQYLFSFGEIRLGHIIQAVGVKSRGKYVLLLADDHLVGLRADLRHDYPAAHGKTQTFPLADGIVDNALVATQNGAVGGYEIALLRGFSGGPLYEARVILIRDKTDLLAVRLMGYPEAQLSRDFPDLLLRVSAHRHQASGITAPESGYRGHRSDPSPPLRNCG